MTGTGDTGAPLSPKLKLCTGDTGAPPPEAATLCPQVDDGLPLLLPTPKAGRPPKSPGCSGMGYARTGCCWEDGFPTSRREERSIEVEVGAGLSAPSEYFNLGEVVSPDALELALTPETRALLLLLGLGVPGVVVDGARARGCCGPRPCPTSTTARALGCSCACDPPIPPTGETSTSVCWRVSAAMCASTSTSSGAASPTSTSSASPPSHEYTYDSGEGVALAPTALGPRRSADNEEEEGSCCSCCSCC